MKSAFLILPVSKYENHNAATRTGKAASVNSSLRDLPAPRGAVKKAIYVMTKAAICQLSDVSIRNSSAKDNRHKLH